MQQAEDFRTETRVLAEVLEPLSDDAFFQTTQFKNWTIDDVLGHLHIFNHAAALALEGDGAFATFFAPITAALRDGKSLLEVQYPWLDGLKGRALFEAWLAEAERVADVFAKADPKARLAWAGPSMSARSSITARQMETWAHGQEVLDLLGVKRVETDRVKNIVVLGVNTFGWTHQVRGLPVPDQMPFVELTAPSGTVWTFGDANARGRVSGSAVGFAQTVTQTRNWADTDVVAEGDVARFWMENAQCFAGASETPPAKGARYLED